MKALFKGQLTMDVYKIVESLGDEAATRNLAHEDITSELFKELGTLVEAKGYRVPYVGINLEYEDVPTKQYESIVNKAIKEAKNSELYIRGKGTITNITF
ncbi:hypothetical protein [Lysinibacillus sphaericus]|uniref:Uncharacterized protein n=1 Tax=Lysinibacillus sphaericus OT4b.31 TaxID=1285586 RepID=R7ZG14_LYSSH|nr:hypothetical protein [Lysinibacillus sphaericus]EON72986.1 hypothetical protein H131_08133 [Lysinibacillus sphaericus OT4b.31]